MWATIILRVNWFSTILISAGTSKKAVLTGLFLMFLYQFSGSFAILTYTADIFHSSGSSLSPNESSIIVAFIQLVGVYVSSLCVDRFGRKVKRQLLIWKAPSNDFFLIFSDHDDDFNCGCFDLSHDTGDVLLSCRRRSPDAIFVLDSGDELIVFYFPSISRHHRASLHNSNRIVSEQSSSSWRPTLCSIMTTKFFLYLCRRSGMWRSQSVW